MQKEFSVVIPVLNEEESLPELLSKIKQTFAKLKKSFEIVFIDDGSTDSSLSILQDFEKKNNNIRVFSFRRNVGKSNALVHGFKNSNGKYILTLDADLQDDPDNLGKMFEKMSEDKLDLVTGWRKGRKDSAIKIISSRFFNSLVSFLFGLKVNDMNSGLKLFKSECAKELDLYGGMHRFIPIIVTEMGYSAGEAPTSHFPRKYGISKYKSTKIFSDIPDLVTIFFLTKYTRRPLHFFGKIGGIILFLGLIILVYLSYLRLLGERIGDRPLLLFGILLVISGIQTIFTGLLADLSVNLSAKNKVPPLRYESKG